MLEFCYPMLLGMPTTQTGQPIQWVKRQPIHLVCTMFMVMFLNGFMTGLVTMTVFALRVVKIHEAPMKALSGLFAAVPGATAPGSCGQLFATTSIRASATPTSASASPDRCPTSPSAPSPRKSAPLRPARPSLSQHWPRAPSCNISGPAVSC